MLAKSLHQMDVQCQEKDENALPSSLKRPNDGRQDMVNDTSAGRLNDVTG